MWKEKYSDCLLFIDGYWKNIILKPKRFVTGRKMIRTVTHRPEQKNYHIIDVPYTAFVPNNSKYRYIFYWDTYFMFQGIIGTKYEWVIPEMIENFLYMFKKYQIIPNFSHPESLGRTQAPFLTSMIFDAFEVINRDKRVSSRIKRILVSKSKWLETRMAKAENEYHIVWESLINVDHLHYNHKLPDYNLNRYGDRDVGYGHNAEKESGWDFTSRFYERCDQFLPIDLNCYLYKYETDFAKTALLLGNQQAFEHWTKVGERRKKDISYYMWNEQKGFFYDYNYISKKQSPFLSLAGFVPLWAGIATKEQAEKMVNMLPAFRTTHGLAITDKDSLAPHIDISELNEEYRYAVDQIIKPKQWDYPNIWPPLHFIVVVGLLRYGFLALAKELMSEYLEANAQAFRKHHAMLEKMDGLTGDMPQAYWYPTQLGYGWTNAIFYRYVQVLTDLDSGNSIYRNHNPGIYPYDLTFIH